MRLVRPTRGSVPRAAWVAAEVTFVSAAAHTVAGGALPTIDLLIALGVPVFALGVLVMQHRLGVLSAVAAAVVSQFGLHVAMAQLAEPAAHPHHAAGLSPGMVVAHGIGALAVAAVWALRRRAWEVASNWPTQWSTPARTTHAVLIPLVVSHVRAWLRTGPRRGPPPAAACV